MIMFKMGPPRVEADWLEGVSLVLNPVEYPVGLEVANGLRIKDL